MRKTLYNNMTNERPLVYNMLETKQKCFFFFPKIKAFFYFILMPHKDKRSAEIGESLLLRIRNSEDLDNLKLAAGSKRFINDQK